MGKYYAILKGRKPGIYQTWTEAKQQVDGFKGAIYKSFNNELDAKKYLSSLKDTQNEITSNNEIEKIIQNDLNNGIYSFFVDGSYNKKTNKIGYGIVLLEKNNIEDTYWETLSNNQLNLFSSSLNVAGEICGVIKILEISINKKLNNIKIYFDYEGIEKWATGAWEAKSDIAKYYLTKINEAKKYINICFQKVKAHAYIKYNEMADQLAKKGSC